MGRADSTGRRNSVQPGYSDCMVSGTVTGEVWWIEYSQHHHDHINAAD